MLKRAACVLLLVGGGLSCQSGQDTRFVKDGVDYGATRGVFRGRWWSYYERGANLVAGGFYQEAEADLRQALSGRSRDSWRARTYGLHFVEYFPNRELGVVLLHTGKLDDAQATLERSLAQMDTAKAHHYLDLVKREKIAKGAIQDQNAPALETTLSNNMLVASVGVDLGITARDDSGVESMRVNGAELYQRGSSEDISYSQQLRYVEGTHEVTIEATDLSDKVTSQKIQVTVDLTAPIMGIREPQDALVTQETQIRLAGTAADQHGVASVSLDGAVIAQSQGDNQLPFATDLALKDGENSFIVVAKDMAGNENYTAIKVFKGDRQSSAAMLWYVAERSPESLKMAALSPANLTAILESVRAQEAAAGVQIELKSPREEAPWRNNLAVRVKGEVTSTANVKSITVNGEPVEPMLTEPKITFDKRIALAEGQVEVQIEVKADDETGANAEAARKVAVKPIVLDTPESRMKLAVLSFGGETELASLPSDLRTMTETVISQSKRFALLERQQLAAVLQEQQLSDELGDREAALQLGKVIPAHAFVLADVIQRGTEAELHVRVINTESTLQMTDVVDTYIENTGTLDGLRKGCDNLREEMAKRFPRISGEVMSVKEAQMLLNWSTADGVNNGMRVMLVKQSDPWVDEDTGEVLEEGETLPVGQGVVTRVTDNATTAEKIVVEGIEDVAIEKGMGAITM